MSGESLLRGLYVRCINASTSLTEPQGVPSVPSDKLFARRLQRAVLQELRTAAGFPLSTDELHERLRDRHAMDLEASDLAHALRRLTLVSSVVTVRWPGSSTTRASWPTYWTVPDSPWAMPEPPPSDL